MASTNLDVIAYIIDNVEDSGTLFSLLTVSKDVFRYTCRILYRDPSRVFCSRPPSGSTESKMVSLIRLLLDISPAADDDTNTLREAFGLKRKQKQEAMSPPTTMLDYLSYIQHIRWRDTLESLPTGFLDSRKLTEYSIENGYQSTMSFFRSALTWSICGHRLGDIRELEIEPETIAWFTDVAAHLHQLRYVALPISRRHSLELREIFYPSAIQFVQALQMHHGKDQLLDIYLPTGDGFLKSDAIFYWIVRISELLPPLFPQGLSLTLPLRPMDGYVSRLATLDTMIDSPYQWRKVVKDYSDMSAGQFLQRCRSLRALNLDFSKARIQDANVFAWAACEARDRAAGKLSAPQVPLSKLHLETRDLLLMEARKVLTDAACGFSSALQELYFEFSPQDERDGEVEMLRSPMDEDGLLEMSQLSDFDIRSFDWRVLDGRLLGLCPKLKRLFVNLNDANRGSSVPLPSWPVVHLPFLESLELCGRAVDLFDPASLYHAPKLQKMTLNGSGDGRISQGDQSQMLDRWTWDWDLANLTLLVLVEIPLANFSFKVLRHCPSLQFLSIEFPSRANEPPFQLDVSSLLRGPPQDVFPNVTRLSLDGNYSLPVEDLKILVQRILPSLSVLTLGDECLYTAQQVIDCTRHHPCLENVKFQHVLPNELELEELGLLRYNRVSIRGIRYWLNQQKNTTLFYLRDMP